RGRLGLDGAPPAAGLGEAEDSAVTAALDLEALPRYAAAVHTATARWLAAVDLDDLAVVPPATDRIALLAQITDGDVPWLHAMWSDKPVAWFVQWEAIGHGQGHLGEMVS